MDEQEKKDILLVEDDLDLLAITKLQLTKKGYSVVGATSGKEALEIINTTKIDLILLDIILPDYDGHEICQKVRSDEVGFAGPIIFMSCLGDSESIVDSFRGGGNDYLVKPAKIEVLIDRIEENLKKCVNEEQTDNKQWFRQFVIDRNRRCVYRVNGKKMGEEIGLSPTEYNILLTMVEHPNEVLLYRQMYKSVWDLEDLGDVRTLMVHVSNLRKKIDLEHTDMIKAIRGVGYLFQDM